MMPQEKTSLMHVAQQRKGAELGKLIVEIGDFGAICHLGRVTDRCTLATESEVETDEISRNRPGILERDSRQEGLATTRRH